MAKQTASMISIWSWVGMVLTVYGAIITIMGLYYAAAGHPETVLGHTNPSLWWGIFMFLSGLLFLWIGHRVRLKES